MRNVENRRSVNNIGYGVDPGLGGTPVGRVNRRRVSEARGRAQSERETELANLPKFLVGDIYDNEGFVEGSQSLDLKCSKPVEHVGDTVIARDSRETNMGG